MHNLYADPRIFLLDEPTNHLDIQHKRQPFGLIEKWLLPKGRAVLSAVHDLNMARMYGTELCSITGKQLHREAIRRFFRKNPDSVYQMDVYDCMNGLYEQWKADSNPSPGYG